MAEHSAGSIKTKLAAQLCCPGMAELVGRPVFHARIDASTTDGEFIRLRGVVVAKPSLWAGRSPRGPLLLAWLHRCLPISVGEGKSLANGIRRVEQVRGELGAKVFSQDSLCLWANDHRSCFAMVRGLMA